MFVYTASMAPGLNMQRLNCRAGRDAKVVLKYERKLSCVISVPGREARMVERSKKHTRTLLDKNASD
jgi:hypothetical protein